MKYFETAALSKTSISEFSKRQFCTVSGVPLSNKMWQFRIIWEAALIWHFGPGEMVLHQKDQRHRQFFARASRLTLHWIYWALLLHICRKSFLVLGDFNLLMANIEHCLYLRWRSYLAVSRYSVSRSAVTLYPSRTFPVSFGIIVNVVILWILLRRLHFVFIITIINNNNVMNHHLPWGGGYEPCTGAVGCLGRTKGWTNERTSPQNPEVVN